MDKEAIINRIKNNMPLWDAVLEGFVENVLIKAEYFDLLEAAERVDFVYRAAKAKGVKIPHNHDCFRELSEALKKAGVDL